MVRRPEDRLAHHRLRGREVDEIAVVRRRLDGLRTDLVSSSTENLTARVAESHHVAGSDLVDRDPLAADAGPGPGAEIDEGPAISRRA